METFLILYALFFVLVCIGKGISGVGKSVNKALPEYKKGDDIKVSYDFKHAADPHELFASQERMLLDAIKEKEKEESQANDFIEKNRITSKIINLRLSLGWLRTYYEEFVEAND